MNNINKTVSQGIVSKVKVEKPIVDLAFPNF